MCGVAGIEVVVEEVAGDGCKKQVGDVKEGDGGVWLNRWVVVARQVVVLWLQARQLVLRREEKRKLQLFFFWFSIQRVKQNNLLYTPYFWHHTQHGPGSTLDIKKVNN